MDPRRVIRDGYNQLDQGYRDWADRGRDGYRATFLHEVLDKVPPGSTVLELGCGPGGDASALAADRRYIGIDLSRVQLRHARRVAPGAAFIEGDLLEIEFRAGSFDAAVAFYVFNHIPRQELPSAFRRVHRWLRPGGWFCASFGTSEDPGTIQHRWLGLVDMYFSSASPQRTEMLLSETGFEIDQSRIVGEVEEREGPGTFQWVMARKPAPRSSAS